MRKLAEGFLFVAAVMVLSLWGALAFAGAYADSAHGDKQYGVRRLLAVGQGTVPHVTGSCAHCHDSPVVQTGAGTAGSALFAPNFNQNRQLGPYRQDDLFCFSCHISTGSLQASGIALGNYDYSRNFGGLSTGGPVSIFDAFNQPAGGVDSSYHNLYDIWKFAQRFSVFDVASSPCAACHNSHRAKRNRAHVSDPKYSAISLPTDHESLWGDQPNETMANYAGRYQPPLSAGVSGGYEPGGIGSAFADGSQLPDYNSFCLSCHNEPIYSTSLGRQTVRIDWASLGGDAALAGDKHGLNAYSQSLQVVAPYDSVSHTASDYLLSCSDCHEPHGSPNAFLLRRAVNGSALAGTISSASTSTSMGYLCRNCHQDDFSASGAVDKSLANRWEVVHHSASDRPYPPGTAGNCATCHETGGTLLPIGCGNCHSHGSYVDAEHPGTLLNGKRIPAPEGGRRKTF